MLRTEVARQAKLSTGSNVQEVVQIGFNAWHYADANLWASLGDEIFRQLAGTQARPRTSGDGHCRNASMPERLSGRFSRRAAILRLMRLARLQAEVEEAGSRRQIRAADMLRAR